MGGGTLARAYIGSSAGATAIHVLAACAAPAPLHIIRRQSISTNPTIEASQTRVRTTGMPAA